MNKNKLIGYITCGFLEHPITKEKSLMLEKDGKKYKLSKELDGWYLADLKKIE